MHGKLFPALIQYSDVLEASSIAWPNAAMWRQVSLVGPYFAQNASPRQGSEDIEAHSHSPRHPVAGPVPPLPAPLAGAMLPPTIPPFHRQSHYDPFTEPVHAAFAGWRHSSADVSMPDYSSSNSRTTSVRQPSDPMIITEKQDRHNVPTEEPDAHEYLYDGVRNLPSAPANTPQNEPVDDPAASPKFRKPSIKMVLDPIPSSELCAPCTPLY